MYRAEALGIWQVSKLKWVRTSCVNPVPTELDILENIGSPWRLFRELTDFTGCDPF